MPKPPGKPPQSQGDKAPEGDGGGDPGSPDDTDDEVQGPDD